jgi:hypothetical protein
MLETMLQGLKKNIMQNPPGSARHTPSPSIGILCPLLSLIAAFAISSEYTL